MAFINAGNLGLSVALFAWGEVGLELATIYYVGTNLTVNTFGAFFAARGNGGGRQALGKLVRLPGLYAFALAIILRTLQVQVPAILLKPIEQVAKATVPIMLILLGVQLSQTRLTGQLGRVSLAAVLRLVGGAAAGFLIAPLLGMEGLVRQVVIMQSATPTAVNSSLMAIEFDSDAEYVTSTIFFSTLFSSVTLTVLLYYLSGNLRALQRADNAGPHTVGAAQGKAYTSASARNATTAMLENVQKNPGDRKSVV